VKRSLLDPLPRQLSTKALAALVALVVCGTGVAVVRFLESGPGPIHRPAASVRAAPATPEAQRAPRPVRPSTWISTSNSTPAGSFSSRDAGARDGYPAPRGSAPCSSSERGGAPTLYRPDAQGS